MACRLAGQQAIIWTNDPLLYFIMATDALAPCITRSSAATVLIVKDKCVSILLGKNYSHIRGYLYQEVSTKLFGIEERIDFHISRLVILSYLLNLINMKECL